MGMGALMAARLYTRIERVLGRLSSAHARSLADWHTPRLAHAPAGLIALGTGRVAIARAVGLERARELAQRVAAPASKGSPEQRRIRTEAKAEVAALTRQATKLRAEAEAAYAEAWAEVSRAERMERARRFAGV